MLRGFAYPVYVMCSVFFERAKIISKVLIQKIFPEKFWEKIGWAIFFGYIGNIKKEKLVSNWLAIEVPERMYK